MLTAIPSITYFAWVYGVLLVCRLFMLSMIIGKMYLLHHQIALITQKGVKLTGRETLLIDRSERGREFERSKYD